MFSNLPRLSKDECLRAESILRGNRGEEVLSAMFNISIGRDEEVSDSATELLQRAGWIRNGHLTTIGQYVQDPIREFEFWRSRNKQLHSETEAPILSRNNFYNKSVVELGSGGGVNLFSLQGVASWVVGIEPMPIYNQMMNIFANVLDVPKPTVIESFAENVPVVDGSFDVVICYSSHQYMDLSKAISEMSRIVNSTGRVIIVGDSLYRFAHGAIRRFIHEHELGQLKHDFLTVVNTVGYQITGKHVYRIREGTTTNPIYPSFGYMESLLHKNQLVLDTELTQSVSSGEYVFVASKNSS